MGNIIERLNSVKAQIPSGVRLIAVSKFHSFEEIKEAYDAGQRLFGENRPQEMAAKAQALPRDIEWHFIGHLQSNKIKMVVPVASLIHSVDNGKLFSQIEEFAVKNGYRTRVLLQMHIASEETKQGFSKEELLDFLEERMGKGDCAQTPGVEICGLMGMASFSSNKALVNEEFKTIAGAFKDIKQRWGEKLPHFNELSIGMSGDFTLAIENGATLVRVGTAIFGERDYSKPFKCW